MAKNIDYPRASLRAALLLADAVDGFAGNCSIELAAEKLGKKVSGAFSAQISATAKYGWIESKGGKLRTTGMYRDYKLAYTPEESAQHLQKALLLPPLFNNIYERFKGQKLPIAYFEKMLIKEFEVPEELASRVSHYFLEGAKQAGLLDSENALLDARLSGTNGDADVIDETAKPDDQQMKQRQDSNQVSGDSNSRQVASESLSTEDFWLNIRGPGINFSLEIKEVDDLEIVQVMLRKITKMLNQNEEV